ncbi:MAG TPA: hypothetical protein PKB15_05360 [Acidimicrobiia bacterium]|nr:hypothetical protein [Acidimicrobiia bacterium]
MNSRSLSLQLQSVIFKNDIASIEKLIFSLKQSSALAIENGNIGKIVYRIGDCSPEALIGDPSTWCRNFSDSSLAVTYEFFNENLGHGGGQNRLAQNSTADILGIINPDVVASPRLISILCNEFDDPSVGIAEASQIPMEHPKDYDLVTRETSFASGCCLFIDRLLFEKLDGFDHESFFMYCDDVDLSWRVRLENRKIVFCPQAVVYHDHRIGKNSELEVSGAEFLYSALGGIMLAYKWGRKDIAEKNLKYLRSESMYTKAVEEFDIIVKDTGLPEVVVGAEKVRIFTPSGFANYRWTN